MIRFTHGDIFAQPAEAIVNPVNCVGVAGAGLALRFRRRHPDAFIAYRRACAERRLRPGRIFLFDTGRATPRWIAHFPTKRHWRDRSAIGDIEAGLRGLAATLAGHGIRSIAIPPLGCGLGGLDWRAVRPLITACLGDLPVTVIVLEPATEAEPCAGAGVRLREEREAMTRDTTSIFDHGATLVPDIVTEAEEERILLRISQAPWMTDLSRRVQHYGHRYDYRAPGNGRHALAPAFPALGRLSLRDRLGAVLRRGHARAVHRQRVPPRPGHRHARRSQLVRRCGGVAVARRRLDDELPAPFGPPLRPRRAGVRPRWPCCRAAPPSSCADPPGAAGCTGSIPPPAAAAARPESLPRSGPWPLDLHRRFRPCRRQDRRPPGRRRGRRRRRGGEELWRGEREGDREGTCPFIHPSSSTRIDRRQDHAFRIEQG